MVRGLGHGTRVGAWYEGWGMVWGMVSIQPFTPVLFHFLHFSLHLYSPHSSFNYPQILMFLTKHTSFAFTVIHFYDFNYLQKIAEKKPCIFKRISGWGWCVVRGLVRGVQELGVEDGGGRKCVGKLAERGIKSIVLKCSLALYCYSMNKQNCKNLEL
ncbi:hypothetical protein MEE_01445 [Bartonella elizabethae F9251 = ATCC 49927]|uniref:Uncharacterized protein n=1 Tax=Bartonella elizabethae F9251 = ATCC 49927 TaxID=1094555 RepID=J1K904_BAREL|nr:hypothetical protein MEE_01445 [Bartonella elizabethae F9251 = ATCC 49927]VEJ41892.1 Uncharacterised protein [Bartonella elizabethae]